MSHSLLRYKHWQSRSVSPGKQIGESEPTIMVTIIKYVKYIQNKPLA